MAAFVPFRLEGVGIHTGARGAVTVWPAPGAARVVFSTADGEVPLCPASIAADARNATDLAAGTARVRTVEHLVAALAWYGVGAARIEVDGPEIPILDGSAVPWCEALEGAGCIPGPRFVRLGARVSAEIGGARGTIEPLPDGASPRYEVEIDFGRVPVGPRRAVFRPLEDDFASRIAPARTFALLGHLEALYGANLARGGDLGCALVLGDDGPVDGAKMRFPDEPARHKILDALGDLAILGGLPWAAVRLERPGHALNRALIARAAGLLLGGTGSFSHEPLL
jgi:UDP-3-O-[3-hydroxymyristoyl] N-acetylglucosamine deacetylase